jgi:hypothetical protein
MNCRLCNQVPIWNGKTWSPPNNGLRLYECPNKHYIRHYKNNRLMLETMKLLPSTFEIIIFPDFTPNYAEIWLDAYIPLFAVPVNNLPWGNIDKLIEKIQMYNLFS